MKVGRNDPCPCGSGKKYKACCLNKEAVSRPVDLGPSGFPTQGGVYPGPAPRPRAPARSVPPPPVSRPKQPPAPVDPRDLPRKARWKEFQFKDDKGRIDVFLKTLDDQELMTDEMAFEMLSQLRQEAVARGE